MTEEKVKVCNGCGQTLLVSMYSRSNGAKYPRSKCKNCERALDKIRKRLKSENPLPPADYQCPMVSGGLCSSCKKKLSKGFHADHVIPHSLGGRTITSNGQALCPKCNIKKGCK